MSAAEVVGVVIGVAHAAGGAWILSSGRARLSGVLLALGGALLLVASGASFVGEPVLAQGAVGVAGAVLVPVALVVYPAPRLDAVGLGCVVSALAAGVVLLVRPDLGFWCGTVIFVVALLAAWWTYEQGDALDRRALGWSTGAWLAVGLVIAVVLFGGETLGVRQVDEPPVPLLLLVAIVPVAMAVGVVRGDVVDVRGLATRTVVVGTAWIAFLSVAIALLAPWEERIGRPLPLTIVAMLCAVLAFGVHPLQVILRGVVDELLFGRRPDPLRAASGIASRVGDDPVEALDAVRESLVLPHLALEVDGQARLASGAEVTHVRRLELDGGTALVVGLRAGDLSLSGADETVLRIVAPLVAQTLRAHDLTDAVESSRERVVAAVEEERRRLRRDLHDGLGPLLSGVAFAADAARNRLRDEPDHADRLIAGLREETSSAIAEVRRIVEGLRPPALDELGLEEALRQHVAGRVDPDLVDVTVEVDAGPLPAALEVAAYRIAVEAFTNATRHADPRSVVLRVSARRGWLEVEAVDDGAADGPWTAGAGLTSMRERAELVGGRLDAGPTGHGGRVLARLPLAVG